MTASKNFKRLVRARMAETGESYMTARAALLAQRADPATGRRERAAAIPATEKKETPQ